jgi:hypothetical protein
LLADLNRRFEGIICAFGLPYLSREEAAAFIRDAFKALEPDGVLYLSAMLGRSEDSGFESCSSGDQVYIIYYSEQDLIGWLVSSGLIIAKQQQTPSTTAAAKATTDLIVIATKPSKVKTPRT